MQMTIRAWSAAMALAGVVGSAAHAHDAGMRAVLNLGDTLRDLVFLAPSPLQDEMVALQWQVLTHVQQPVPPDADAVAAVRAQAEELYQRVRARHVTRRMILTDDGVRAEETAPVLLARGLRYIMLIEVSNACAASVEVNASIHDVTRQVMPPLWLGSGEWRPFWVIIETAGLDARMLTVCVTRVDQPAAHLAAVPVLMSDAALIRGSVHDDATSARVPGRVYVCDREGGYRHGVPLGTNDTLTTKMLVDLSYAGRGASYSTPFFYSDSTFEITVPPGPVTITAERGFEHAQINTTLVARAGMTNCVALVPPRMVDMRARGWISGDTHVHWAKNNWYENEDMALLGIVQRAEDVRVVNNLTLLHSTGTHYFIAPTQFPMGPVPGYCDDEYHIEMGEEYRNEEYYGHINILNITNLIWPISTGSINVPPHWDYPINAEIFRAAHAQGGIVCEAHGLGRNNDVPANVMLGLSDALDQLPPDEYYRFLDCGIQIPLANGSDHPARITGSARVYVKHQGGSLYQGWIDGIRSNKTVTTSGPLLLLEVNGHDIGDELHVDADTRLEIVVTAWSRHPLGRVEIVSNGEVIASTNCAGHYAELRHTLRAGASRWIVARCSQTDNFNVLSVTNAAHTSAVYVQVDRRPRLVPAAVQEWIRRMQWHADDLAKNGRFEHDWQRREAVAHVRAGIAAYERLLPDATNHVITLTPVQVTTPVLRAAGMREGQELSRIAFTLRAPWMSGRVELRFPEVLRSTWGMHFLDHYMQELEPISEWRTFPQWQTDEASGRIWYDFTAPEGIRIVASATPAGDAVHLTFTVVNESTQAIAYVEPNCCLMLNDCPELNDRNNTGALFAMLDGAWTALDQTTPTAAQMGRTPWLALTREQPTPALESARLWCVDQHVTDNLMGAVTRDKAHLIGYTWSVEPRFLMSNCGNPCLHTGGGSSPELAPGERYTWQGRIYCMQNNPRALIERYRRDQEAWRTANKEQRNNQQGEH